jgi:NADH-quinone oxidoreductase subunit G
VAAAVKGKRVAGLVGDLVSTEAAFALKALVASLGGTVECRTDGAALPAGNRSSYVGTARIADIDAARRILLVGTNPRLEAPVLNARIRKAWLAGALVASVGEPADLTYPVTHLGSGVRTLADLNRETPTEEERAIPSLLIVGLGALRGERGAAVLAEAMALCDLTASKLLVLHTAAGRVGAMDLGCVSEGGVGEALKAEVIFNLGADEIDVPAGPFVVYQGSHGDRGAHRADVILPGAAWTEESGIFVNTEGRPQMATRAGFPPREARENWAILRALSAVLGETLPFDSLAALRRQMFEAAPHLARIDEVPENAWTPLPRGDMGGGEIVAAGGEHYLANPIMRASEVMAELARLARERRGQALAAE